MCGICGIWYKSGDIQPSIDLLKEMTNTFVHRGPDEEGHICISDMGLGHRRLKIIDLSTGQQPMTNEDGSVWIVFNGEIYNFLELRDLLVTKGHIFKSRCDTEVLVHLYEEYGAAMTDQLRGMFAFAIWDDRKQQLFLCRDRLGIKPLYFFDRPDCCVFSSELKSLLPLFEQLPELCPEALADYFTFGYIPSPYTPFSGIKKLAPATRATITRTDTRVETYWTPCVSQTEHHEQYWRQRLEELLDEAVRIRLVSDVDFGAFLSGGVDSSTVCALMRRHISGKLKTFSIGFEQEEYDELPHAGRVASFLHTDHHTAVVRPDAISLLPQLAWHFDEPFADSSAIPTWYVCELARKHVTMVHSGDGGDELFGGYTRYGNELWLQKLTQLFGVNSIRLTHKLLSSLPKHGSYTNRLLRILSRAQADPATRYKGGVGIFVNGFEEVLREQLRDASCRNFEHAFAEYGDSQEAVTLRLLGLVDVKSYLPEDILTKVDRMSMAHSLEARVPLLDHKFVEFAFTVPDRMKFSYFRGGKQILKELAARLVPPEVIYRPKKGFGVPLAEWFRKDLYALLMDLVSPASINSCPFLNHEYIKKMIADHKERKVDHAERLWALLMFRCWQETHLPVHRKRYQSANLLQ